MKEFAHAVLTLMTVALAACAALAALFWVMSLGDRRPEVPASYWFGVAIGSMAAAGLCAWCVVVINHLHYLVGLHQMVESEMRRQQSRESGG